MSPLERDPGPGPSKLATRRALAPGRRRSGREFVREAQRARIISAMTSTVCARGVEDATIDRAVSLAQVSRRTFYELFADRSACLLQVIDRAVGQAEGRALAAAAGEETWSGRIRAGLHALLEFCDDEPELARLCMIESAKAGPAALLRRGEILDQLARVVDSGRASASAPPPLTAEVVVGGLVTVIQSRLVERNWQGFTVLLNPLMSFVVFPFLGEEAARRELDREHPPPSASKGPWNELSRLAGLDMRMTHRTIRTLAVIAAESGLSNLEVSRRAGVADQGQISKLLARLARLGLIENLRAGGARGGCNQWRLTARGEEVERAITREAASHGARGGA